MNIKKYFMLLIVVSLVIGTFGAANAVSPNAKCGTQMSFTFDPNTTVADGTPVTMTEEVITTSTGSGSQACGLEVGSNVDDGNAQIQAVTLGTGGPGKSCDDLGKKYCTEGTSIKADKTCDSNSDCITDPPGDGECTTVVLTQVAHENPSDGVLDYSKDTTGLGGQVLGYQASYQGGGNFENAATICTDVTVNQSEACTGATINIDLVYGPGAPTPGGPYEWRFAVTVHACEDLIGVTAQGGTNGWATLEGRSENSLSPSAGTAVIRKANKKTDVILWTIGDMKAGATETLGVLLSGSIPSKTPDCQVRFLSGPWSALFSIDGINFEKTDYTGRVSIAVDNNGNPDDCGL